MYLPAYRWVLERRLTAEVAQLRRLGGQAPLVLLDDATNTDVDDPARPLSHAGLVAACLEDRWPASASTSAMPARCRKAAGRAGAGR